MPKKQGNRILSDKPQYMFNSAEHAWFWFCRIFERDQAYMGAQSHACPPCESNDIYIIVKKLIQNKELSQDAVKVLFKYGKRQEPPDMRWGSSLNECLRWNDAMALLEDRLDRKRLLQKDDAFNDIT